MIPSVGVSAVATRSVTLPPHSPSSWCTSFTHARDAACAMPEQGAPMFLIGRGLRGSAAERRTAAQPSGARQRGYAAPAGGGE